MTTPPHDEAPTPDGGNDAGTAEQVRARLDTLRAAMTRLQDTYATAQRAMAAIRRGDAGENTPEKRAAVLLATGLYAASQDAITAGHDLQVTCNAFTARGRTAMAEAHAAISAGRASVRAARVRGLTWQQATAQRIAADVSAARAAQERAGVTAGEMTTLAPEIVATAGACERLLTDVSQFVTEMRHG